MRFQNWISESSLKDLLSVPQKEKHHPEGDVFRHTMMVRGSLNSAIELIKNNQQNNITGPLSNLDLNFSQEDINILKFAGLLHDIGKGEALDPNTLSAHGHENPKTFEIAMKKLGPWWQKVYEKSNSKDKEDLWWIIKYHMSLKNEGFLNKKLKKELLDDNGKYKNDRKVKLLLVLLLMDRMGRGETGNVSLSQARQFAKNNTTAADKGLEGIYATSNTYLKDLNKTKKTSTPSPDNPKDFVDFLKKSNRTTDQIKQALQGKFGMSPEDIFDLLGESKLTFKNFMESQEKEPSTMKANIPLGEFQEGAQILSNVFKDAGFTIYVVGGTVRDYLMSKFHNLSFNIKDVDFATNALTADVKNVLEQANIKQIAKGESFGVISAIIDKKEYEIATFREESGYSDRRRPDEVKPSDAKNDYKRRDFTVNALFYDMPKNEGGLGTIIDFGGGKGFEDIKQKRMSAVGSPHDRFSEDPLRVLRAVRFHGVFNKDHLKDVLDAETFEAMKKFSTLEGVSPERIQAEFVSALIKAQDPKVILHGFESIGALPYMFPGLSLDMDAVDRLSKLPELQNLSGLPKEISQKIKNDHNNKKVILTLALLLRNSAPASVIRSKLNKLKWPNEIADEVAMLVQAWAMSKNPNPSDMSDHANFISKKNSEVRKDLLNKFSPMVKDEINTDHMKHLSIYNPPTYKGDEIRNELGLEKMGPEIGRRIKQLQQDDYSQSFQRWKNSI